MSTRIQTPIVCGMQRSASRLTWQIVKILNNEEIPEDYVLPPGWTKEVDGELVRFDNYKYPLGIFPLRDHGYWPEVPVIYTYRNPIESFLSLRWKYISDVDSNHEHVNSKEDALKCALADMALQQEHYKNYLQDSKNGRKVLFLKYEDYYQNPKNRITSIINFVGFSTSESEIEQVLESTSINENFDRGVSLYHRMQEEGLSFSQGVHGNSGMQMLHVSPQTMGVPGAWSKRNKTAHDYIMNSPDGACSNLREFAKLLGYDL